ncbi:PstS family phosphate ABC transporter substrate-binding protein [Paenibacillus silviterrae]|uniref:PstS family phosphate ABC transporter substrate-binding protein n=1 Tax=Paenibacillus silviterrae TaxID=3242194 RepID=UPI0025437A92|nr:substrate-binding domain-containing protein [Paenibacillus chinjuensis]
MAGRVKALGIRAGWILIYGLLYFLIYGAFTFLSGFAIVPNEPDFLYRWPSLSDTGVLLLLLLYSSVIGMIFVWLGTRVSQIASQHPAWLPAAGSLLVPALGLVIWNVTFFSLRGSQTGIASMEWLLFTLYNIWMLPLVDTLQYYVTDATRMKYIGALVSLLPTAALLAGIRLHRKPWRPARKRQAYRLGAGAAVALVLIIVLTGLLPKGTLFTWKTYPTVDGATAAIPFGKLMLSELTGTNRAHADRELRFYTSHEAYVNLIEKRADLILVSGPSKEELALAEQNGVKLKLTPIGKDAFIFLVHKENPVSNLSLKQIQDIYTGDADNWKQLGGEDSAITAFQREANSGSQTFMENKVMKGLTMANPPMDRKVTGMGGLMDAVADYKNSKHAIGYTFYYFANEMHRREEVKFLALDGIEPNKDNIRSEKYPLTAPLYAVTREGEPEDGAVGRLLAWLQSSDGARLIERGGFVPIWP